MSDQACVHGMPSPKSCIACMEDFGVGPEEVRLPGFVRRFKAIYQGFCSGCKGGIEPGDTIVRATDDTYWCEYCGQGLT